MKAVQLEAIGKLAVIETEPPTVNGADEVLIKVQQVGICGSELHAFDGTHPYRKPPSILGHEMVGTVEAVGAAVAKVKVGDRVTIDPQWTCGECEWCKAGDHNLCPKKMVLGTVKWPGALGEYIISPESAVYAIPPDFSDDQAVTLEPLSVGVHTVNRGQVGEGDSVLVLGGGPIGLLTAAMARVRGASPIIVADVQQHCLDTALEMGYDHTILVGKESIEDRVGELIGEYGVDVVFLTSHAKSLFSEAFKVIRRQGRIVIVALFEGPIPIDPYTIIKNDMALVGTIMATHEDMQEAIDVVVAGKVHPELVVTHHLSIDAAQEGFELAASKEDGAIKVVLTFP